MKWPSAIDCSRTMTMRNVTKINWISMWTHHSFNGIKKLLSHNIFSHFGNRKWPAKKIIFAGHFQCKMTDENLKCLTKNPNFVRHNVQWVAKSFREAWPNVGTQTRKAAKISENTEKIPRKLVCTQPGWTRLTNFSSFKLNKTWQYCRKINSS